MAESENVPPDSPSLLWADADGSPGQLPEKHPYYSIFLTVTQGVGRGVSESNRMRYDPHSMLLRHLTEPSASTPRPPIVAYSASRIKQNKPHPKRKQALTTSCMRGGCVSSHGAVSVVARRRSVWEG